ncbi:hypothetical protein N7478_001961 [Penicillium angulare]|uniref:uncharacterized protein n=1 Tax=Penicillium angulare TaxID=116970 RepID=UPI002540FE4A|nr:uncharacterized protein N7478_001961 [Penicillium angulare]KAJ5288931.1 hypothetical protein N7478_001961 [Penicillium angulare]
MNSKERWSISSNSSGAGPESLWEEQSSMSRTRDSLEERVLLPGCHHNNNLSPLNTPPSSIQSPPPYQSSSSPLSTSSSLQNNFLGENSNITPITPHLITSRLLKNAYSRDTSTKNAHPNSDHEAEPRAPKKPRRENMQEFIGLPTNNKQLFRSAVASPTPPLSRRCPTVRLPGLRVIDAADPFNQSLPPRVFASSEDNPYQDSRGPENGLINDSSNTEDNKTSQAASDPEYLPDSPSPRSQPRGQTPDSSKNITSSKEDNKKSNLLCEFSLPCKMGPSPDGMHFRKIVSHVFGRNKASTKLFPDDVWVYFCRKHYQRARYRADQWPFTQCDLLQESLSRIEEWNGVESFELTLRRRESMRVNEADGHATNGNRDSNGTGKNHRASGAARSENSRVGTSRMTNAGRRHPTAVIAPVPEWLRKSTGPNKSFTEIRAIVDRIREYLAGLRDQERAQEARQEARQEAGETTSRSSRGFRKFKKDKESQRHQISQVRFPDVEILPRFRDWVIQAGSKKRNQTEDNGEADVVVEREAEDDQDEKEEEEDAGLVGRTGRNRGQSASQRRRNDQHWRNMVERVSPRGTIRKPRKH